MIKSITKKAEWENFLEQCGEKSFLNSWSWGEFQESRGFKIWRLGCENNSQLQAIALAVKIKARRGTFLLIQHGPNVLGISTEAKRSAMEPMLAELAAVAKKEGAIFIRMNPLWERNGENANLLETLGLKLAPMHANAYEATWRLDIGLSEEDLLKAMRKTTRYLIRQAQKNPDISIIKSERLEDADAFEKLSREVAARQKFSPFSRRFTKKEFEIFSRGGQALWFFGKYKEEYAAASLVIFWQGTAYYHQAASLAKYAKLSIPYLLQWEAIKEAKKRGCRLYDFWGYTDPKAFPGHPWAGPTLFKMGFGGQKSEYVLTQDYPLSFFYWPVYFFEKIRKAKRNL
jgi:lipid II:glycine glycyltransferase (peptidoglycan interpeptide bridge formation enzyme)